MVGHYLFRTSSKCSYSWFVCYKDLSFSCDFACILLCSIRLVVFALLPLQRIVVFALLPLQRIVVFALLPPYVFCVHLITTVYILYMVSIHLIDMVECLRPSTLTTGGAVQTSALVSGFFAFPPIHFGQCESHCPWPQFTLFSLFPIIKRGFSPGTHDLHTI